MSTHLVHDIVTVYTLQKNLIGDIQNIVLTMKKLILLIILVVCIKIQRISQMFAIISNFGMKAEINFLASSHKKTLWN